MVSSSSSFEDNASVETLVVAGITFGLAHVLSGPDHLCALAVIASSSSSSSSSSDDDSCDDDDENDQDCNDLNIERVDVNDDGKKRMRRETKNAKDDDEESGVVVMMMMMMITLLLRILLTIQRNDLMTQNCFWRPTEEKADNEETTSSWASRGRLATRSGYLYSSACFSR